MSAMELLVLAIKASIFLTVLGLGLSAERREPMYLLHHPGLLVRSLLSMFVVMPVFVGVLVYTLDFTHVVEVALIALMIAPVPPLLPKKELKLGGRSGYAVGLLVVAALTAIVLIPFAVEVLNRIFGARGVVSPWTVAKIMLTSILVPLALGIAIRHWWPSTAEKASSSVLTTGGILLIVGTLPVLVAVWPDVRALFGNGTVLVIAIVAAVGLAVGHALGGPQPDDRTVLALSTSSRHPAVALTIATSGGLESRQELAAILLYIVVALIVSIPYTRWRRRRAAVAEDAA